MSFSEKFETHIYDYVKREEYRSDLTRIESRVNSLAESQAMASVAMQAMSAQIAQTNDKIEELNISLCRIDKNLEVLATNRAFQNGAIMMLIKVFSVLFGLVTLDYIGFIKFITKYFTG